MAALTDRVTGAVARRILKSATVSAVADLGPVRRIKLAGSDLIDVAWTPGDKIRFHLGGFDLRTYTPMSWEPVVGSTVVLAYRHGDGPGATRSRDGEVGAEVHFLGPQRSVRLDELDAAPLLVGDETSIGLHAAWRTYRPDVAPVAEVMEVSDGAAFGSALAAVGLGDTELVERRPDDAHLDDLARLVADRVRTDPAAPVVLTGRAQTIAAIRRHLKDEGLASRSHRAKAYWDPNRSGLD